MIADFLLISCSWLQRSSRVLPQEDHTGRSDDYHYGEGQLVVALLGAPAVAGPPEPGRFHAHTHTHTRACPASTCPNALDRGLLKLQERMAEGGKKRKLWDRPSNGDRQYRSKIHDDCSSGPTSAFPLAQKS